METLLMITKNKHWVIVFTAVLVFSSVTVLLLSSYTRYAFVARPGGYRLPPKASQSRLVMAGETVQTTPPPTPRESELATSQHIPFLDGYVSNTTRKPHIWSWFSFRSYWRAKLKPGSELRFDCGGRDIILLRDAYLSVDKLRGSSVVLFAGGFGEAELWRELKDTRDPSQLWVFNSDESALSTRQYLPPYEFRGELNFNITFTFHSKAELSLPYGHFRSFGADDPRRNKVIDLHRSKPRFAAWTSSHCTNISWDRPKFAEDLASLIPLDRYGKCGNLTSCPRSKPKCTKLLKEYKFIFALENSCCEEYITEKFWYALSVLKSVPVVVGASREDYERVGPPNSFIHAGDFDSMEDLASYLRKVADDPVLYNSYVQWHSDGVAIESPIRKRRVRFAQGVCFLQEYIKSGAWSSVKEPFDVHSDHWLSGCHGCIEKSWFSSGEYNETAGELMDY